MVELKDYTKPINGCIEQAERELNMIKSNITDGDYIDITINNLFKEIENIINADYMTNEMLKKVIKISVDSDGTIDISLNLDRQEGFAEDVHLSYIST